MFYYDSEPDVHDHGNSMGEGGPVERTERTAIGAIEGTGGEAGVESAAERKARVRREETERFHSRRYTLSEIAARKWVNRSQLPLATREEEEARYVKEKAWFERLRSVYGDLELQGPMRPGSGEW